MDGSSRVHGSRPDVDRRGPSSSGAFSCWPTPKYGGVEPILAQAPQRTWAAPYPHRKPPARPKPGGGLVLLEQEVGIMYRRSP